MNSLCCKSATCGLLCAGDTHERDAAEVAAYAGETAGLFGNGAGAAGGWGGVHHVFASPAKEVAEGASRRDELHALAPQAALLCAMHDMVRMTARRWRSCGDVRGEASGRGPGPQHRGGDRRST